MRIYVYIYTQGRKPDYARTEWQQQEQWHTAAATDDDMTGSKRTQVDIYKFRNKIYKR